MEVEEGYYLGKFFQHKNGEIYELYDECQTQVNDVWYDFVLYANKSGDKFSRSKEDFFGGKFKLLSKTSW